MYTLHTSTHDQRAYGSLKDSHGMVGWKLEIRTRQMTCIDIQKGSAPVDCNPNEQSSTRCELSIILACITAVVRVTLGQSKGLITT